MITFQIAGSSATGYTLRERDYPAQGISPFYTTLCRLTEEEASALNASRLVSAAGADAPPRVSQSEAARFLSLREDGKGGLDIRIELPAGGPRQQPFSASLPGYDGMLSEAAADPAKAARFLEYTGIADRRMAEA